MTRILVPVLVVLCAGPALRAEAAPPEGAEGLRSPRPTAPVTADPRFAAEFPTMEPSEVASRAPVSPTGATAEAASPTSASAAIDLGEMPPEPREPSPFHAAIDLAWQRAELRFVTPMEFAVSGCGCGMDTVSSDLLRGTLSFGWAGLSLEGSIARAVGIPDPFTQWTAGVRLDTAYRAALSFAIRAAYLRRTGAVGGEGGRGALALQIRFIRQLVIYAEAGVDITNVPQNEATVLSYSFYYSAGMRVVLGR